MLPWAGKLINLPSISEAIMNKDALRVIKAKHILNMWRIEKL